MADVAPSGANSQPWEFVVVKESETREKIAGFVKDLISIYYRLEHTRDLSLRFPSITKPVDRIGYEDAPVYIIPCGDRRTRAAYPLYTAVEIADSILESSMANAFLYMHLAATALGLGAQWVSAVRMWYVQQLVRDLLGIPDYFMVYDMLVLGTPFRTPSRGWCEVWRKWSTTSGSMWTGSELTNRSKNSSPPCGGGEPTPKWVPNVQVSRSRV